MPGTVTETAPWLALGRLWLVSHEASAAASEDGTVVPPSSTTTTFQLPVLQLTTGPCAVEHDVALVPALPVRVTGTFGPAQLVRADCR